MRIFRRYCPRPEATTAIRIAALLMAMTSLTACYPRHQDVNTPSPGSLTVKLERWLNWRQDPRDNLGTTGNSGPRTWYGPNPGSETLPDRDVSDVWRQVYANTPPRIPVPRMVHM